MWVRSGTVLGISTCDEACFGASASAAAQSLTEPIEPPAAGERGGPAMPSCCRGVGDSLVLGELTKTERLCYGDEQ